MFISEKRNRLIQLLCIVILTIAIFALLFQHIPVDEFLSVSITPNYALIALVCMISLLSNIFLSSYRWKVILNRLNCPATFKQATHITLATDIAVNIMPFKTGEVTRAVYLRKFQKCSYKKSLFSLFAEYILNFASIVIFFIGGLALYLLPTHEKPHLNLNFFNIPIIFGLASQNNQRLWPGRIKKKIEEMKEKYQEYGKTIFFDIEIQLLSLLIMGSHLINVYLLALSFDVHIPFFMILLYIPLIIIIGELPVTIGAMGIREVLMITFFAGIAPTPTLLAIGVYCSFAEYVVPLIFCGLCTGFVFNQATSKIPAGNQRNVNA